MPDQFSRMQFLLRYASAAIMALVALMAVGIGSAKAAAIQIDCPVDQVTREITSPLSDGWWQTPIVNGLESTEIAVIGGKPTLVCRYASSGSIMSLAPEGASCTANGSGFACASGGVVAPSTLYTAAVELKQTFAVNFDGPGGGASQADLWFEAETADQLYLTPRNGAELALGDRSNRGAAGCVVAHFSAGRISLSDVPVGSYVCIMTSQGHVSQFRLNGVSGSPKVLSIGFTTWN